MNSPEKQLRELQERYDTLSSVLLHELGDKVIAFRPIFARIAGSVSAGLLLSQMYYWGKGGDKFYKSAEEWYAEVVMKKYEFEKARKTLVELGVIETWVEKDPKGTPKMHYRLLIDRLVDLLQVDSHTRLEEGLQVHSKNIFKSNIEYTRSNTLEENVLSKKPDKTTLDFPDDEVPFLFSKEEGNLPFAEPDTPPKAKAFVKNDTTPPSPHVALMLAISQVMLGHNSHKLWTRDQSMLFGKTAKKFRENGISEVDLMAWYETVWKPSFFGLKGSRPTYNQMMAGIGAYMEAKQTKSGEYLLGFDDYEGDAS